MTSKLTPSWPTVNPQLTHSWHAVAPESTWRWLKFYPELTLSAVDPHSCSWSQLTTVDQQLTTQLTQRWPSLDPQLTVRWASSGLRCIKLLTQLTTFLTFFSCFLFCYFAQHCFVCRSRDSTVSEDAGIVSDPSYWLIDGLTTSQPKLSYIFTSMIYVSPQLICLTHPCDLHLTATWLDHFSPHWAASYTPVPILIHWAMSHPSELHLNPLSCVPSTWATSRPAEMHPISTELLYIQNFELRHPTELCINP